MDLVLDQAAGSINQTHRSIILHAEPVHIVGVTTSLIAVRRDVDLVDYDRQLEEPGSIGDATIAASTPTSVSLYTVAGYKQTDLEMGGFNPIDEAGVGSQAQNRNYFCSASVTAHQPTWAADPDIFGYFADGGIFAEYNSPVPDYGIRLIVRYVPRLQFSPAYHDPLVVMQHYWKCSHGDTEFLEGFYGGTVLDIPSNDSGTRSIPTGSSTAISGWEGEIPPSADWDPLT